MKIKLILFFLVSAAVLFSGCAGSDGPDGTGVKVSADELYSSINVEGGYKQWNLFPGTTELAPAAGVHGDKITIYISDDAHAAVEAGESVMPYESVILKEGYDSGDELEELVVMYKVEGYDPDNNDWFWAIYSPEGDVTAEGRINACINCHSKKRSNDFIFTAA